MTPTVQDRVLRAYYAATALFLLLDALFDVNVRLAFLEPWPAWRAVYYLFCFTCLAVIVWRPGWTTLVTTVESLITLSALIISMGARVLGASVTDLETGRGIVTLEEVLNFIIAGGAAWYGWVRGMHAIEREWRQ